MSASSSTSLVRGCCAHKDAIEAVQREQRKVGTGGAPYLEAVAALEAMQRRLDWQAPQGVVDSDGVGRKLSVQLLKHRWSHVETGGGLLLTWAKLKERLKSHCYEKKEDAPLFLLVKFYNDGFEKRSFFKRGGVHRVGGISRCRENVEWVDGLTLDFDAGLTVEQFVERYGSYEYLIYSSFNHAPLDGKNKFRVVMPLKDRVRPVEIENRRRSLMELFKDADPASFSISQGFYIPTHPTGIEPVRVENPGEWFDLMELEVMPRSKPAFASSIKVIADGDAPGVIAALMNCMPPDTECLRELPGTNGHSYAPVIVPLLSSLGFWGREQGMDEEDIHELVMQRWGMSPHSDSFYRLICGATYGGLECGQSFVERVGRAVSQGIDLGIPKDEFERARDELNGLLKQQVEVRPVEVMDLDAATNKLQNLLLQRMYGYGNQDSYRNHLIIRYEAGAGKTKHAHTMLWLSMMIQKPPRGENRYWVVDYLVPDNTLGGEIAKRLRTESKDRGVHVQHIQGRKQLCIDPKVKEAEGLGYEVRSPCEGCTYVSECEYLKQYQQPKGEHWIRVLYQGMASNQKAKYDPIESPDFFVVDEDMVTSMYAEREYGHVYGFIREMPASLNAKSTSAEIRNAIGGSLRPEVKELRGREDKNSSLPAVQFSKFRKGDIDRDEFRRQLEAKRNKEAKREGKRSVADCSALLDDLMHRPQAVSVREGADGVRSIISSSLRPLASRYAQSPCIYLDATAEKLVIERALCDHEGAGRGIDYWECNVAYSPSVKVYQDTSRSWSMQSLCPRAKGKREVNEVLLSFVWDEMVRRSFLAGKRFAIVTYKAVAEYIDSGRTPPGSLSLKESPLFCGVGHFGNIRGLDCFNQEGISHLYVIGRMQVSSEVVHNYARAAFARDTEPLHFDTRVVRVPVGPGIELEDTQYVDERVQSVNRLLNTAETAQAAHRLRLIHGDQPKELFLITNAALPIRVGNGLDLKATLSRQDELRLALRGALATDECALRTGKQWKAWPACLNDAEDRMRRGLLNNAEGDAEVCSYACFRYTTRKADRKKRDGIVIGADQPTCEAFVKETFSGESLIKIEGAAKKYKTSII